MSGESVYVSKGLSRVCRAPAFLRAVVGPGYVVCIRDKGGEIGGMVHIQSDTLKEGGDQQRFAKPVAELIDQFRSSGAKVNEMSADIVGGADILHIYPQRLSQQVTAKQVEAIKDVLVTHKIAIARTRVGGCEARRVEMELPGKRLEVRAISRARRKKFVPVPSPISALTGIEALANRLPEIVVNMGCLEVAESPTSLVALLGSCVGIALYDPDKKIGALAHVMLPDSERGNGHKAKFADTAVPALIEALVKAGGNPKSSMAKIAGGANVLHTTNGGTGQQIGAANINSAIDALSLHGYTVAWQDTGGQLARKMIVDLVNFDVRIKLIERTIGG